MRDWRQEGVACYLGNDSHPGSVLSEIVQTIPAVRHKIRHQAQHNKRLNDQEREKTGALGAHKQTYIHHDRSEVEHQRIRWAILIGRATQLQIVVKIPRYHCTSIDTDECVAVVSTVSVAKAEGVTYTTNISTT